MREGAAVIGERLPEEWRPLLTNVLGEYDLGLPGERHGVPKAEAEQAAEGWDGFHVAAFTDRNDSLAVVGISVWDSEPDAVQFARMFEPILEALHGVERFVLLTENDRVRFVTGLDREMAWRVIR